MKKVFKAGVIVCLLMGMFGGSSLGAENVLMMATTTSTDNTGLLDYLAPAFTKTTGEALRMLVDRIATRVAVRLP